MHAVPTDMGYSQSSLVVRGKPKETVLAELRLRPTGKREDFAESLLVCAQLPTGWVIVVAQRTYPCMIGDSTLRRLSAGCEVVTCGVEEHVMVSEATLWRAGECVWRVSHDATHGVESLHVEGELPLPLHQSATASSVSKGRRQAASFPRTTSSTYPSSWRNR